jgi:hypothetical protein
MSDFVYQGMTAPNAYRLNVVPGTSALDLSTIASAVFKVRRRSDDSTATWAATLSNQTATTLTLTYVFLAGDIDLVGTYEIYALLTIVAAGGTVRTGTRTMVVKGTYEAAT